MQLTSVFQEEHAAAVRAKAAERKQDSWMLKLESGDREKWYRPARNMILLRRLE